MITSKSSSFAQSFEKFLSLSLSSKSKNLSKLWAKDEDLEFIAKEYAKIYEKNNEEFISKTISFSKKHKAVKNFKKRLKGIKVVD